MLCASEGVVGRGVGGKGLEMDSFECGEGGVEG